jgi:nucleoside-diphosphate-sugar epimerase
VEEGKNQLSMHPADVEATWADIRKAKKLLKWKPKTAIEEGMKKTAEWFLNTSTTR